MIGNCLIGGIVCRKINNWKLVIVCPFDGINGMENVYITLNLQLLLGMV